MPHTIARTVTPEAFKDAFRRHPAGVAVVTADPGDGPVGLTATSVASVSADPPLIVFSVSDLSSSTPAILRAETIVVHLVDAANVDVAQLCATSGIDRFADTSVWDRLPTGEPRFTAVPNWLRCRITRRYEADLSTIVIAEVLETGDPDAADPTDPLVYHNRVWYRLGPDAAI